MIFDWLRIRKYCVYILIAAMLFNLHGCGTSQKKHPHKLPDAAPKCPPANILRTPDAIPKVEPLSKYGNRFKKGTTNVYVTKKRRYKVLPTSKGYKARGKASWYGTKFHGRKTSSGEPYNMYAMTAAHTTLPLPSYIKVTNLHNRKSVIVKVNDRGPFHSNRVLDVSYAAAAKLGILGNGTADVEIESVDPRDHGGRVPKNKMKNLFQQTPFLVEESTKSLAKPLQTKMANNKITQPKLADNMKTKSAMTDPKVINNKLTTINKGGITITATAANKAAAAGTATASTAKATTTATASSAKAVTKTSIANASTANTASTTKTASTGNASINTVAGIKPSKTPVLYLELGLFKDRATAEALAKKVANVSKNKTQIARKGKPNATDANKSLKYLVRIGPMKDNNEAIKLTKELAKAKLPKATLIKEQQTISPTL